MKSSRRHNLAAQLGILPQPSLLDVAISKVKVPAVWRALSLHGTPAKSCLSPLRVERNPSFSISDDGKTWYDHGLAKGGGLVDFVAAATGCTDAQAASFLIALAGLNGSSAQGHLVQMLDRNSIARDGRANTPSDARSKAIDWPVDMHVGSEAELLALSALRQLHRIEGLKAASEGGLLWFCTLTDWISPDSHLHGEVQCPAWFLTDAARVTALARRLDGRPWNRIGGKKAWLLPGSRGVWPIGISEVGCRDTISIVEGGPDFLALHCWLHMTRDSGSAPVALASCNPIAAEALPHFKGKQVQLFCHNDGAVGDKARITWTSQLVGAGAAAVTNFWFCNYFDVRRGKAPKDLNDFFTGLMAGMIYPASGAAGRAQQHQAAA